jgi:hypothetical protein
MSTTTTAPTTLPATGDTSLTIVEHYGALRDGEESGTRTTVLEGLADEAAGEIARMILGRRPATGAPGPGTHRLAVAGGSISVTVPASDQDS